VNADADQKPIVIKISPMAHFAVGFLTLGMLAVIMGGPSWVALLLVIPILLSVAIARYRTVADSTTVTARSLLGSETVDWDDIDGLRFDKSSWARAHLKNGQDLRLPGVTFATLPQLTEVSAGRVPNPYS
jgi:hypothetical protein